MPTPVSDTDRATYRPGSPQPWAAQASAVSRRSAAAIVSSPPPGIASRALVARLMRICSIAAGSARTELPASPAASRISISAGSRRRRDAAACSSSGPSSRGWRSRRWRRAKPSNLRINSLPRRLAAAMVPRSARSAESGGSSPAISSVVARMVVSRLLKSCAMPPASWPTASIFCACRRRWSSAWRSLRSSTIPSKPVTRPAASRRTRPLRRTGTGRPSFRFHVVSTPSYCSCSAWLRTRRRRSAGSR